MRRETAGIAILVLFFASLSFAQTVPVLGGTAVPPVIRFSGTLGVSPGPVPVTFSLYADQTGGTPLWQETQTVAVDTGGRYVVVLGTTAALPTEVFVSGEARWLEVAIEGLDPRPRALLVSVPYALKAADADTVGGKPLSAFVLAGEKTGVGTDGLNYVNTRLLAGGLGATAGAALDATGTANWVAKFGAGGVADTNSSIYDMGNVGIGTTVPDAPLHVKGGAPMTGSWNRTAALEAAFPVLAFNSNATRWAGIGYDYSGLQSFWVNATSSDIVGTGTRWMNVNSSGHVGLGTLAPEAPLHVKGGSLMTGSWNRTATLEAAFPVLVFNSNAKKWAGIGYDYSGLLSFWVNATSGDVVGTGTRWMNVDSSGNVGIGTAAPSAKLTVAGTIESTTGGFKFPDGTTQATAAGAV
jgi:hypothetical protein